MNQFIFAIFIQVFMHFVLPRSQSLISFSLERWNFPKCPICSYPVRNVNSSSSRRDLLLSLLAGKSHGFVVHIRTLRTTGCRASITILTDNVTNNQCMVRITPLLVACGVAIQIVENRPNTRWVIERFDFYVRYMEDNIEDYDRVLMADLFDIAYQGDPFTTAIKCDSLYFSAEPHTIEKDDKSLGWLRGATRLDLGDLPLSDLYGKHGINGGFMIGGIRQAIIFCREVYERRPTGFFGNDQGTITHMIHSGFCERQGIYCDPQPHGESFYGCAWQEMMNNFNQRIGYATRPNHPNSYWLSVHFYDRSQSFVTSIARACPRVVDPDIEYIRGRQPLTGFIRGNNSWAFSTK